MVVILIMAHAWLIMVIRIMSFAGQMTCAMVMVIIIVPVM
jgi:hypothetical protein